MRIENEILALQDQREFIKSPDEFIRLGPADIAFYGGSYFPPHSGHIAVAEAALQECVDYVVFCPHYFNPQKDGGALQSVFKNTLELIAACARESEFHNRLFVLFPSMFIGIQNKHFLALEGQLRKHQINSFVLCGADAIVSKKHDYILKNVPHIIAPRDNLLIDPDFLTRPYRILKTVNNRLAYLIWKNVVDYCQAALKNKSQESEQLAVQILEGYLKSVTGTEAEPGVRQFLDDFRKALAGNIEARRTVEATMAETIHQKRTWGWGIA